MALTISVNERGVMGNLRWVSAQITFDTTYPTGGETGLTAASLGLDAVLLINFDQPAGITLEYNYSNGQVLAYRSAVHTHALHLNHADVVDGATTRVNAGTNLLGANTGSDIAVAGVAATTGVGGIVQAAQGALGEVSNTVDLSTIASAGLTGIRCFAFGR